MPRQVFPCGSAALFDRKIPVLRAPNDWIEHMPRPGQTTPRPTVTPCVRHSSAIRQFSGPSERFPRRVRLTMEGGTDSLFRLN